MRSWIWIVMLSVTVCVSALAHGPSRQKVTKEINVNAPAAKVWALIADFCSIEHWHPAVGACRGEGGKEPGATRSLTIGSDGGPVIDEELQKYNDEMMMYKYKITHTDNSVLPVTTYSAFLSVHDNGDETATVRWRGGFYRAYPNNNPPPELNDEAALNAVTAVYDAGLASIKEIIEDEK